MEEQALYRAILAAPNDDTPRLVYADWLDENADSFPEPLARVERARAEFIRLECKISRRGPGGWGGNHSIPIDPVHAKRHKRLILQHGKKWRRAYPLALASSPFDRGFLRPRRAMRPQEFLEQLPSPQLPIRPHVPPLPPDSSARRYVPTGSTFHACPLWDVHLYATPWDPLSDQGQYGPLLAEVARSPHLARVGWLKVSFFGTPVLDFLRTGNFANVETLVLNAGPFPGVLEAITENESFRSLRYIHFGEDREAWITNYPTALQFNALSGKIRAANERHVPHGEMRAVLRSILNSTPLVPAEPPPAQTPVATPGSYGPAPLRRALLTPEGELKSNWAWVIGAMCVATCVAVGFHIAAFKEKHPTPANPAQFEPAKPPKPLSSDEIKRLLNQLQKQQSPPTAPSPRPPPEKRND